MRRFFPCGCREHSRGPPGFRIFVRHRLRQPRCRNVLSSRSVRMHSCPDGSLPRGGAHGRVFVSHCRFDSCRFGSCCIGSCRFGGCTEKSGCPDPCRYPLRSAGRSRYPYSGLRRNYHLFHAGQITLQSCPMQGGGMMFYSVFLLFYLSCPEP